MRHFEYRLSLGLQETNVVGNVYFANYFLWQGKCREDFLRRYAPQVLQDFKAGFGLITQECSCVFHEEAFAFQNLVIRMGLERLTRTGMSMVFDYYRENSVDENKPMRGDTRERETLLAQGRQAALWVSPEHRVAMMPEYLYRAIHLFVNAEPTVPERSRLD
jgi:enediyne core biosynthesis thioesterase